MNRGALACALALLLGAAPPGDPPYAPMFVQRDPLESHRISGETVLNVPDRVYSESVGIEVTVGEDGAVIEARPDPEGVGRWGGRSRQWQEPALALARQWRFRPFLRDGRPVVARGRTSVAIRQALRLPARHLPFPEVRREDVRIRLTRSACYGSCPDYSVTISGDGNVLFVGNSSVSVDGEHRYAVPVERVEALIRQFRDADFWSLDDRYEAPVTDSPTYTLTFSAGNVTKTVTDYVGDYIGMPRVVTALEQAVDEAGDTARWVTGNERTLASLEAEHFDFRSIRAARTFEGVVRDGPDGLALALLDRGAPLNVQSHCPLCARQRTVRLQALHDATVRGRVAIFDRLASDATLAALPQQERDFLLGVAARARNLHMVQRLLASGARATATGEDWGSVLIQAVSDPYERGAPDADQEAVVRLLLARGAPIEARDLIDWTALQHASDANPAVVRVLLEHGARVDAAAGDSRPLLYMTDDEDIALLALAAGANRNLTNSEGETLSQIARRNRWARVERMLAHP